MAKKNGSKKSKGLPFGVRRMRKVEHVLMEEQHRVKAEERRLNRAVKALTDILGG